MSDTQPATSDVFEGRDSQWYWRLRAANGEIVAQSEGYTSKDGAERGLEAMYEAAREASNPEAE